MLFSSPIFLFVFLPLCLLGYFLFPRKAKNYFLLLASLVFFAWGGVSFSVLLIVSIIANYFFGIFIEKNRPSARAYWWSVSGVSWNIIMLGIFKYANFLIFNLNNAFSFLNLPLLPQTSIVLPVGISFYTFHLLSYLIDIYKGKTLAQKNIFDLALYVSMFSQLIAGPIIRYSDVYHQLKDRVHSAELFSSGVERFIIGLGKKVLLANTFAQVVDSLFSSQEPIGVLNAWLAAVCYFFQIYCDFSGYSDMAIGLGRMFGFDFLENFNFPYMAKSVKEFWRRWHMSLSTFFRDYFYIPIGGSRVSTGRVYLNLFLVFFLTGFWHGASWTFVAWGLFHGFFMILERIGLEKLLQKCWSPIAHAYTLLVVMFAWILFRADTLEGAFNFWTMLFDFTMNDKQTARFMGLINSELIFALLIAVLGSFGFFNYVYISVKKLSANSVLTKPFGYLYHSVSMVFFAAVLFASAMYLIAGTYNPFIYYKF